MSDSSAPAKKWEPPSIEELSAQLPQYQIEALLGRGGMGAVYKGRQTRLERPVAIKILPVEMGERDVTYAQRFQNEARAMAKLNHPGIVAVYDFGETAGGLLYFVMEFIEGTDVAKMIQLQTRLRSEEAMAITAHVCDALGYAHSLGILHRDIKPANIMVGYDGRVKVADFGLAKVTNTGENMMTRTGVIMGTLSYMAPESLILGAEVDKRADIYAVGVMLYQMLTGKLPHGMFEMPSLQVKGLDPRYDKIVATAMREDRQIRYASADALRVDLDAILTQPVAKVEASSKDPPPALNTQASPRRPAPPSKPPTSPPTRQSHSPSARRSSSGWGLVSAGLIIAAGIGLFLRLSSSELPDMSPPVPNSTKPPAKQSTPSQKTTIPAAQAPALASRTENLPPATTAAPPVAPPASVLPPTSAAMPAVTAPVSVPVGTTGPAPIPAPATPLLPPELAALDLQFQGLKKEKVTVRFEADLENLNKNYLGGIARALSAERAAGRFDLISALEAEQKRILDNQPVPETDDAQTHGSLQSLRTTYRDAYARLVATRAANLQALTDPLDLHLVQMLEGFTQTGRLADAEAVSAYRQELSQSRPAPRIQVGAASPGLARVDTHVSAGNSASPRTLQDGITNTLGMKFIPVKGASVLFCVHETRQKEYAAYAVETQIPDLEWKSAGIAGDHPVTMVSWDDAQKFCAWLSAKEGRTYRLPTDREWSIAAGIGRHEKWNPGDTPATIFKEPSQFPWGDEWPPPKNRGNYAFAPSPDRTHDDFPTTAPVMTFRQNSHGLYDMGGNVWEWVEDYWNDSKLERVLRGASFTNADVENLRASFRLRQGQGQRSESVGFRCVVELK
jgi:serine/threonine protein kinase